MDTLGGAILAQLLSIVTVNPMLLCLKFMWITRLMFMQSSDSTLRTNDQYFSLTDQLNMGVRAVELDTHWVEVRLQPFRAAPDNIHAALHVTTL